jgi:hypothetical protein
MIGNAELNPAKSDPNFNNVTVFTGPGNFPDSNTRARTVVVALTPNGVPLKTGELSTGTVLFVVYRTTAPTATGGRIVSVVDPENTPPARSNTTSSAGPPAACNPPFNPPGVGVSKYPNVRPSPFSP